MGRLWSGSPPAIIDVREEQYFRAGRIEGSVHGPDSNTMALVRIVRENDRVVLVCEDGRLSAMVARTLGVCGFPEVVFLEGGLRGWSEAGGPLVETTPSGGERRVGTSKDPGDSSWAGRIFRSLSVRLVFIGLAASAAVLGVAFLYLSR
jgi:rhodanese-related sulfurtransferase